MYGKYQIVHFFYAMAAYQVRCFLSGYFNWTATRQSRNHSSTKPPEMRSKHTGKLGIVEKTFLLI